MADWPALLESMHSAVIDTLNELYPKESLTLGLPKRVKGWEWPLTYPRGFAVRFSHRSNVSAAHFLVLEELGAELLGGDLRQFWVKLMSHATPQFALRRVQPVFEPPDLIGLDNLVAFGAIQQTQIRRLIWIPFECRGRRLFFGLAIESPSDSHHNG